MEDVRPAAQPPREFPLVAAMPTLGAPLMAGLLGGLFTLTTVTAFAPEAGRPGAFAAGLAVALATATLVSFWLRRQIPDRVRLDGESLALARGDRAVRRIALARLGEVSELPTLEGPVLLLSDDRSTLALARAQLVNERDYEQIEGAIVQAVGAADPSGELGRRAARTGRLRNTISQQPVRATPLLAAAVGVPSLLAFAFLEAGGQPYPLENVGALSLPLVAGGETFRLVSYLFIHASGSHLVLTVAGLLWLGAFLEKLVGWERVVLAFAAGAAGGAAGHFLTMLPTPAVGATAGLFGLFGLLGAIAIVGRRRLPRALLPRASFWLVTLLLAALLPFSIQGPSLVPVITWVSHLAGGLSGFVLGLAMVAGRELPVRSDERDDLRAFAWVACAALAIGLVGAATHPRRDHGGDAELITGALLDLPKGLASALVLNQVAYEMLTAPHAGRESFDHAARLATAAVDQSERQHAEILDTLAVARYRLGSADDAQRLLEEALKITEGKDQRLHRFLERRLRDVKAGGDLTPDAVDTPVN